MSNSLYFLRHAETNIDTSIPPHEWSISSDGLTRTKELAKLNVFQKIDGIVYSSEKKAYQTAEVFAKELPVDIYELSEFSELRRKHESNLSETDYRRRVREVLTHWDSSIHGWESVTEALGRITDAVTRINRMFYNKNVLVVSHGLLLTIYFCHLKNFQSIAYERWSQLSFLAWGLVQDGHVLIDII
ncbi:MAG: histidine phosphatase family protein [Candidatus Thorarchaeota archaeon]|nr:histidine phosphatase family protein [Candidatus Thorarchaeota archaeon]